MGISIFDKITDKQAYALKNCVVRTVHIPDISIYTRLVVSAKTET